MRLRAAGEAVVIMTTASPVAHAQSTCREATLPTIRASSTLVAVPTLVRLPSGEFVKHLDADQIELFDNGIRQKVRERGVDPCGTEFVSGVLTPTLQALK